MKRFLMGTFIGLFIGWLTVPVIRAAFVDDDEFRGSHAYKWYLTQMLKEIKDVNSHLAAIESNTLAVKEKLHA